MQAITDSISDIADRDLERRVVNYLAERHVPALRYLEVEAHNGTVTLRGRVQSFYEKQLCQAVCRRVAGVVRFVDAIDVAYNSMRSPALVS
ncbi:MAG TPA: BON domain-containing protein [Pirellulales bacterium]|nr:BON domain-containing protein [Pirellulales bacterium]